jgi:hypothetical protein
LKTGKTTTTTNKQTTEHNYKTQLKDWERKVVGVSVKKNRKVGKWSGLKTGTTTTTTTTTTKTTTTNNRTP